MGKVRSERLGRKHSSRPRTGGDSAVPTRDELIAAVREAGGTESVDVEGEAREAQQRAKGDAQCLAGRKATGGVPVINLAALRDVDHPDYLSDVLLHARVRALCAQQGITVVDRPLDDGERAALDRATEVAARERSSAEGWWRAKDHAQWKRECLTWCREHRGSSAPRESDAAPNPFDVLVTRAGRLASLRVFDPRDAEARRVFFSTFYSGVDKKDRPSIEQLQTAMRISNALEAALYGNDPRVWHALETALTAMRLDARYVAIEHLQTILLWRLAIAAHRDVASAFRSLVKAAPPKRALAQLKRLDPKFAELTEDDVLRALEDVTKVEPARGRAKSVLVALARLMVKTGAFDTIVSKKQDDNDPEKAVQRVTRLLSQAWTQAWKSRKNSSTRA